VFTIGRGGGCRAPAARPPRPVPAPDQPVL